MLNPKIIESLQSIIAAPFTADAARLTELDRLALWIGKKWKHNEPIKLNFICTHNSRRSVFGQFWGKVIPTWLNIPNVETFSGGTEVTACHPNTIEALIRVGAIVKKGEEETNSVYQVSVGTEINPLHIWSKLYDDSFNPATDFAAVMTCTSADEGCPFVAGATVRVAIPFQDPKYSDGSANEITVYDNCTMEVGKTLWYVFEKAKNYSI